MENNKKVYLLSSIVALMVLSIALIFVLKKFSTNENGTIILEFIDLDSKLVEKKEIEFEENDTLYDVCKKEYDNVVIDSKGYLKSIGDFETNDYGTYLVYISLYVDDAYSDKMFNQIEFKDQTRITFKLDKYIYA